MPITLDTLVVRSADVFAQQVDSDIVILNVNTGYYFGAEHVGTAVWDLMETPIRMKTLVAKIHTLYPDASVPTLESDLTEFVTQMVDSGIALVVDEPRP